jgi:uncharacterized protein (DUF3820 family)
MIAHFHHHEPVNLDERYLVKVPYGSHEGESLFRQSDKYLLWLITSPAASDYIKKQATALLMERLADLPAFNDIEKAPGVVYEPPVSDQAGPGSTHNDASDAENATADRAITFNDAMGYEMPYGDYKGVELARVPLVYLEALAADVTATQALRDRARVIAELFAPLDGGIDAGGMQS